MEPKDGDRGERQGETDIALQSRSGMAIPACSLMAGSGQRKSAFCLNYVHCPHLSKRYILVVSGFGRKCSEVHVGHPCRLTSLPFLQASVSVSLPQILDLTGGPELAPVSWVQAAAPVCVPL